jgi:hypothetical protein
MRQPATGNRQWSWQLDAALLTDRHTGNVTRPHREGKRPQRRSAANTADPFVSMIVNAHTVYVTTHGNGSSGTVSIIQ